MEKKKKHRIKILNVIIAVVLLIVFFIVLFKVGGKLTAKIIEKKTDAYLASSTYTVKLYDLTFKEVDEVIRGAKVILYEYEVKKEIEGEETLIYRKIKYNGNEYLIDKDNVVLIEEEVVKEVSLFVRTNITVYTESDKINILGYVKKGEEVFISGFDKLNEDGSVLKYKIKYGEKEGYAYSKYLVVTKEEALTNYDQEGIYQIHAGRKDTLGGGSGGNLDYFPREAPQFEDNIMPEVTKSMYLNGGVLSNIDGYIALAKKTGINAFVVDVKENTAPSYPSKVMEEYTKTTYSKAINSWENYAGAIKKLKESGFYVIGRITTFKDSYYVTDNPNDAITSRSTGEPFLHNGSTWPSPYIRRVWEYNVKLAIEAVKEIGFNEIQFDYVRFTDRTYTIESQGLVDMRNIYGETKAQAIQNFLMYACDEIHNAGAYVSADVFGETSNTYVTAYGQYWPAISNVVDAISAMPYPDHFSKGQYGLPVPWEQPYTLMKLWSTDASKRQKETPTPATSRTWIQAHNSIYDPKIPYGPNEIKAQIQGLNDGGLNGGFMTWLSTSNLSRYEYLSSGW